MSESRIGAGHDGAIHDEDVVRHHFGLRGVSYALVTRALHETDGAVVLTVSQDSTPNEKALERAESNWTGVLKGLKQAVEG